MRLTPAQRFNPAAWILLPLMRALNRRRNPTRSYPAARVGRLELALDTAQFCGIRFGAAAADLETFGPANWHQSLGGLHELYYYASGLVLRCQGGALQEADLILDPSSHPLAAAHSFEGADLLLTRSGRRIGSLGPSRNANDLARVLGAASYREPVGDRELLHFAVGRLAIDAFAQPATGKVESVIVSLSDD